MLSYTSGTTGDPKGVKLTHKMVMATGWAMNSIVNKHDIAGGPLGRHDTYISYLPAAHSFEQGLQAMSIVYGAKMAFYSGNILKLTEDMGIVKPTMFPSVPRLFNRIYGKIKDKFKAKTGVLGALVQRGVNAKMYYLKNGEGFKHWFYDKIVFGKVQALLGGKVRVMCTGSAPIAGEVLDFLKICFGCPIMEGYGMTETCGGACLTAPTDPQTGIVGGPFMNVKLKLRDIPAMGYFSTGNPPRGEICFKGPSIMKSYFKNPEKTKEAFHNGWLLSGDVGEIQPNGAIKIIDRAKNIFKLSQGEFIAPEKLENIYVQSEWVT